MKTEMIIHQTKVETEVLKTVTQALELTIAWAIEGDDIARKLSSVRFATETFQRHLERLFALEEFDGYMEVVSDLNPDFTGQIADLKRQHEQLRSTVRRLVLRLETAPTRDPLELKRICERLQEVVRHVLEHSQQERTLFIDATLIHTGGES